MSLVSGVTAADRVAQPSAPGVASPVRVPCSGSIALRPLLAGKRQELVVAATFPAAVYLADPRTGDVVLTLVARDGVAHPNALVLPQVVADDPFTAARDGQRIVVGHGRASTPWGDIEVARWWSPVPSLPGIEAARLRAGVRVAAAALAREPALPAGEAARFTALRSALIVRDGQAAERAASSLIGLGAGLTPTGDDLLAGLFAGLVALGRAVHEIPPGLLEVAATTGGFVTGRAPGRTTAISASLLRHAVRGEVCLPARGLLLALCDPDRPEDLRRAVDRLVAVGATSGRDLALGLLAAAELLTSHLDVRSPGAVAGAGGRLEVCSSGAVVGTDDPVAPAALSEFSPATRRP